MKSTRQISEQKNRRILSATCTNCKNEFKPYGNQAMQIPHIETIKCPVCNLYREYHWLDDETNKMLVRKQLKLENETYIKRITFLEKENELLKERIDLLEIKTKQIIDWAKKREQDFKDIELIAQEENEFRENNR